MTGGMIRHTPGCAVYFLIRRSQSLFFDKEFRDMHHAFCEIRSLCLHLCVREDLLIFLFEHECAGGAAGDDAVVPAKRLDVELGMTSDDVQMAVGLNRCS